MRRILSGWIVVMLLSTTVAVAEQGRRQVLAVTPVLLDTVTEVGHPQQDQVQDLLRYHNKDREHYLIGLLKEGGRFFDVRPVESTPESLFAGLVAGSGIVGEEAAEQRHYQFAPAGVRQVMQTVVADQLLVLILHGERPLQKRWDRNRIDYLETRYSVIVASAYLLDATGRVVWQFAPEPGTAFLPLQYPNFDDAHYNKSDRVPLVYLKVEGLERHLLEKESTFFNRPSTTPKVYKEWQEAVAAQLQSFLSQ